MGFMGYIAVGGLGYWWALCIKNVNRNASHNFGRGEQPFMGGILPFFIIFRISFAVSADKLSKINQKI